MNQSKNDNRVGKGVQPPCLKDMKLVHSNESSHPLFEKFLEGKLDERLVLPTDIILFRREDKSIAFRQLDNLQKELLRERTAKFFEVKAPKKLEKELPKKTSIKPFEKVKKKSNSIQETIDLPVEKIVMKSLKRPVSDPPAIIQKQRKSTLPDKFIPRTTTTTTTTQLPECTVKIFVDETELKLLENTSNKVVAEKNVVQKTVIDKIKREASDPPLVNSKEKKPSLDELKTTKNREKHGKIVGSKIKKPIEEIQYLKNPGDFLMKYEKSKPYNVFLSSLQDVQITWSKTNSITFPEILDLSLGEIEKSFYITNRVDIDWLRFQYLLAGQKSDSFIICSSYFCSEKLPENIQVHKVDKQNSQIIVLKYANGVRIIVISGGLAEQEWENRTQVVWMSPHLSFLQKDTQHLGESKTEFKKDFISYLMEYKKPWELRIKMIELINLLSRIDFSPINVFFLGSVPGVHKNEAGDQWGLGKLAILLSKHAQLPSDDDDDDDDDGDDEKWPIVVQVPTISPLGKQKDWFTTQFLASLSKLATTNRQHLAPDFKCIYPSLENRDLFIEENPEKNLLFYSECHRNKQQWFDESFCQWKTGLKERNQSVPRSKIYTRISRSKKSPWIVMTNQILHRDGWGHQATCNKNKNLDDNEEKEIIISTFNAGIVFFPKFLTGGKTFLLQDVDEKGTPPFPVPFDVPVLPYKSTDKPFTT